MPKRAFSITGLLKLLVVAVLAVCMLAAAAGCGAPRLSTPSGLNINELDLTLNWNDVSGAAYYTVRIRGNDVDDEVLASNNSYSLERYAPGGYTVSVRAEAGAQRGKFLFALVAGDRIRKALRKRAYDGTYRQQHGV